MKRLFLFSVVILSMLTAIAQPADGVRPSKPITLEDIWLKGTFRPQGIYAVKSMADGEHYCVLTSTSIDCYSYATGEREYAVCFFQEPGRNRDNKLPEFESFAFDKAERQILLSSGFEPIYRRSGVSDYYIYNIEENTFTKISGKGKQRLTTFSPDGSKVAFVRENNLFYMDLATQQEHQITTDGAAGKIIYGTTDWVYEEEFGITQGFQWSPDGNRIAFYRFDESRVKEYDMQVWGDLYPRDYSFKYPKAGEANSRVDVWIYDLSDGRISKPDLESQNDQYLPRFQWTASDSTLAVMRMNRLQNKLEILMVDVNTLEVHAIYEEQDTTAYVEVPSVWTFLSDGKYYLLSSEHSGYNHIYILDVNGEHISQITRGNYDVVSLCGIDEKHHRLYYTSHESSPLNTDFSVIGFNGKGKKRLGKALGTYSVRMSDGCKYYFQSFSTANTAPVFSLHRADGRLLQTVESNALLQDRMEAYGANRKEFGQFTTTRGDNLNYYIIRPENFDSSLAYPLFFYVYGGPGNQQVVNAFAYSDHFWLHMLSQMNCVVVCFDGRGTGGRGSDFKKQTYKDLGYMECEDAIEAARYFGAMPWIDANRIGIFGWSFGGYLSTLAILKGNDVFSTAIAVAPVTNWRFYDNIYTERFLQRPQDNPDGYDNNSPLNFADRLQGHYLIVHGTGDDNVHFQNSAAMIEALERAGKQFEMRIYPNKNHSILGAQSRLNLYQLMTDFLMRNL